MQPVEFAEQTVIFAKNQPEYMPLPAAMFANSGQITCCWKLSLRERVKLLFTGILWHSIWTFHQNLQPQLLDVNKPDMSNALAPTEQE